MMTVNDALKLARNLKFGSLSKLDDPFPSVDEAIELIHEARGTCGFNWLTGEAAEDVLQRARRRIKK